MREKQRAVSIRALPDRPAISSARSSGAVTSNQLAGMCGLICAIATVLANSSWRERTARAHSRSRSRQSAVSSMAPSSMPRTTRVATAANSSSWLRK